MRYLMIIPLILLLACSQDDDNQPDQIAQAPDDPPHMIEGLINGETWFTDSLRYGKINDGRLYLTFQKDTHNVTVGLQNPTVGLFPLDPLTGLMEFTAGVTNGIPIHICDDVTSLSFGSLTEDQNGMIEITKFDISERIISGTFETIIFRVDTFTCTPPFGVPGLDSVYFDTTLIYTNFIFTDVPFE